MPLFHFRTQRASVFLGVGIFLACSPGGAVSSRPVSKYSACVCLWEEFWYPFPTRVRKGPPGACLVGRTSASDDHIRPRLYRRGWAGAPSPPSYPLGLAISVQAGWGASFRRGGCNKIWETRCRHPLALAAYPCPAEAGGGADIIRRAVESRFRRGPQPPSHNDRWTTQRHLATSS